MESATVTVLDHPSPVRVEQGAVYEYLLSINPLHNFRRWLLYNGIYCGSFLVVNAVVLTMALLA